MLEAVGFVCRGDRRVSKGTRLFQATGSPLIEGESKAERSWAVSFGGALLIGLAVYSMGVMIVALSSGTDLVDALTVVARRLILTDLLPGVVGAALGVTVARAWGARRGWSVGAATCVATILLVELIVGLLF